MENTNTPNLSEIQVGRCSLINIEHPEWGTFGVREDHGFYFTIWGRSGHVVLNKSEAVRFWNITYFVSPHVLANEIAGGCARELQDIRDQVERWHKQNSTFELDAVLMLLDKHISHAEASAKREKAH